MEQIKIILENSEIRPSHHRIKILQYLDKQKSHPTAEDIYEDLVTVMPTISKATVYNTLKLFQEKGMISAFNISGQETVYDYPHGRHAHFHCTRCGKVLDIESDFPCLEIEAVEGHSVKSSCLFFRGVCKKCRKAKKGRKKG